MSHILDDDDARFEQWRKKLANMKEQQFYRGRSFSDDHAYAEQLARQNIGRPCLYCSSVSGHYSDCLLMQGVVNQIAKREIALQHSLKTISLRMRKPQQTPTTKEAEWLKAQHIAWEGDTRNG